MSRSKAQLVEKALSLGISNAAEIPYDQLAETIRDVQAGGKLARSTSRQKPVKRPARGSQPTKPTLTAGPSLGKSNSVANPVPRPVHPLDELNDTSQNNLKIQFYRDREDDWRWHILSRNGRVVAASSEGFLTKWGAKRNFKKVIGL